MDKYISEDKVGQLMQALRKEGLPYVYEEGNTVFAVLSDGTPYRIGIVEHHSCEEILADVTARERKALSYLNSNI